jgi:hypothetical protein
VLYRAKFHGTNRRQLYRSNFHFLTFLFISLHIYIYTYVYASADVHCINTFSKERFDDNFSGLMQLDSCDSLKKTLHHLMLCISVWCLAKYSSLWGILYALFNNKMARKNRVFCSDYPAFQLAIVRNIFMHVSKSRPHGFMYIEVQSMDYCYSN